MVFYIVIRKELFFFDAKKSVDPTENNKRPPNRGNGTKQ